MTQFHTFIHTSKHGRTNMIVQEFLKKRKIWQPETNQVEQDQQAGFY